MSPFGGLAHALLYSEMAEQVGCALGSNLAEGF